MAKDSLPDESDREKELETPSGMTREAFLEREARRRQVGRPRGRSDAPPHQSEIAALLNDVPPASELKISVANESTQKKTGELSSEEPKLILTLEGNVIAAKEYSWVSGAGLVGCAALLTDGSSRFYTVTENPTELEFCGLNELVRTFSFEEKKLRVLEATGLDDRDELPWLSYDSSGDLVVGQIESDLLDAWLDKEITLEDERLDSWGAYEASQFSPGFELMGLLDDKDRNYLGLHVVDQGGPASSVPCVSMTSAVDIFNRLMELRRLPYVMVDDEGAIES